MITPSALDITYLVPDVRLAQSPKKKRVLCVRTMPRTIPSEIKREIERVFGRDVAFVYVNPQTPEELAWLSRGPGVVAVYLQERPLPIKVLEEGATPCLLRGPTDNLARLTAVTAEIEPFSSPSLVVPPP